MSQLMKSKNDYTNTTPNLIFFTRCEGTYKYNICCGPPPKSQTNADKSCTPTALLPNKPGCCGVDAAAHDRIIGEYTYLVSTSSVTENYGKRIGRPVIAALRLDKRFIAPRSFARKNKELG